MSGTISIAVVLSRMEITHDGDRQVTFEVEFVKEDGSIRKMKAQNHVKHGSIGGGKGEKSKFKYNLRERGAVLLFDVVLNEPRSVRIDRIIRFNGENVIH